MKVLPTKLAGVYIIEPQVFYDDRGFFLETYNQRRYAESGINCNFVQDNLSRSVRGTLRGLHYQLEHGQAKLIQVIKGEVFDVVVDIRRKFRLEAMEDTERTCIIVVQVVAVNRQVTMGISVDEVSEVLDIDASQVEPTPEFGAAIDTDFILAMGKVEDKVIMLLDIVKVLSSTEIDSLRGVGREE